MKYIFILIVIPICSCTQQKEQMDHLNLKSKLEGSWQAIAFDGELHEIWRLNDNGWMLQEGHYIEKSDTSYSAKTQIEKIGGELLLISIIRNSNPKIFKAVSVEENEIIFENTEYKNPYQVKYEFLSPNNYRRSIKGYEKDNLVVYEFNFEKVQ